MKVPKRSDQCDPDPEIKLVSIFSDEPEDVGQGGDGSTWPDVAGAEFGSDDREFQLRAERQGGGDGRIYTVTYEAVDSAGNQTLNTATVTMPHSRGGR